MARLVSRTMQLKERMNNEITLRLMQQTDLAFADSLRSLAGWNQTLGDWKRFLAFSPQGCFLAEYGGAPAGTVTTMCYGKELAWIGMLLVHPDARGRGIGCALLARCVEHLRAIGIACIKLDATPQGKALYDQFGFEEEWSLTRWETRAFTLVKTESEHDVHPYAPPDQRAIEQLDGTAFGVSRETLLEDLLRTGCPTLVHKKNGVLGGYGVIREGARAHYLGPLVAPETHSAAILATTLLSGVAGKAVYWDIPDLNTESIGLATALGFTRQRALARMFLGRNNTPGSPPHYFAIADPALG